MRRLLMARLNRDAELLCHAFGLRCAAIEADRDGATSRYGICYSDGTIRIRLRHATTGRPLKYSSLVNTLCHELAHLRHFDHGARFKAFYLRILAFARARGIYRPGAPAAAAARQARPPTPPPRPVPPRPVQLDLFSGGR